MELYDFLQFSGAQTQRERVLLALLWAERELGTPRLAPVEIAKLLDGAREPTPGNIHQVLVRLLSDKLLNRAEGKYSLTRRGIERAQSLAPSDRASEDERDKVLAEISASLANLIPRISGEGERDYVAEAVSCLHPQVEATRSAMVMGWNAVIANLRAKVEQAGFARFNAEFTSRYAGLVSRRRPVQEREDLEDYKDCELLEVCGRMGILDGFALKRLRHHLDLRNACGHPAGVKPGVNVAKSFFEEIVEYVLGR
jgi:hypothetical protein